MFTTPTVCGKLDKNYSSNVTRRNKRAENWSKNNNGVQTCRIIAQGLHSDNDD